MFLWMIISFPLPPLYLAVKQKWNHFAINLVLMIVAIFTLPIFGLGVLFWGIAMIHTDFLVYRDFVDKRATKIASHLIEQDRLQRETRDQA